MNHPPGITFDRITTFVISSLQQGKRTETMNDQLKTLENEPPPALVIRPHVYLWRGWGTDAAVQICVICKRVLENEPPEEAPM